jgi:hypothetical protein
MAWAPFCNDLPQRLARPGEINFPLVDAFSLAHLAVGLGMGALGLGLWPTLAVAVAWEVAEHLLKDCAPAFFVYPTQDTLTNAAGDVVVTLLGWLLTRIIRDQWTDKEKEAGAIDETDATPGYGRVMRRGWRSPRQTSRDAARTSRTSVTDQPIRSRRFSSFWRAATSS